MYLIDFSFDATNIINSAINAYKERTEVMKNNQPVVYNFNIFVKDENDAEKVAKVITKQFEQGK